MIKEIRFSISRGMIYLLMITLLVSCFVALMLPDRALAQVATVQNPELVQVTQSNKSFPETLKAFKEEVSKAGWSLLNANNMAGVLSERGFTLHPIVILDVCSGKYSAQILSKDDYRPISAFMPCSVSIYQTSDGKVFTSRMNTNAFLKMMPAEVAEVMSASDEEIAKIIAKTVR